MRIITWDLERNDNKKKENFRNYFARFSANFSRNFPHFMLSPWKRKLIEKLTINLSEINVNFAIFGCACEIFALDQAFNALLDDDGWWKEATAELRGDVWHQQVVLKMKKHFIRFWEASRRSSNSPPTSCAISWFSRLLLRFRACDLRRLCCEFLGALAQFRPWRRLFEFWLWKIAQLEKVSSYSHPMLTCGAWRRNHRWRWTHLSARFP